MVVRGFTRYVAIVVVDRLHHGSLLRTMVSNLSHAQHSFFAKAISHISTNHIHVSPRIAIIIMIV
jgi:hypothetical protein